MKNSISYRQKKRFSDLHIVLTFSVSVSCLGAIPLTPEEGVSMKCHFSKLATSVEKAKEEFFMAIQAKISQKETLLLDIGVDETLKGEVYSKGEINDSNR